MRGTTTTRETATLTNARPKAFFREQTAEQQGAGHTRRAQPQRQNQQRGQQRNPSGGARHSAQDNHFSDRQAEKKNPLSASDGLSFPSPLFVTETVWSQTLWVHYVCCEAMSSRLSFCTWSVQDFARQVPTLQRSVGGRQTKYPYKYDESYTAAKQVCGPKAACNAFSFCALKPSSVRLNWAPPGPHPTGLELRVPSGRRAAHDP